MRKTIVTILIFICLGVMGYSGYQIFTQLREYRVGDSTYQSLEENIQTDTDDVVEVLVHPRSRRQDTSETLQAELLQTESRPGAETDPSGETRPAGESAASETAPPEKELLRISLPEVDFEALKKENPDVVGWVYCEDTRINYPVVQGPDNDYYLHRMFNGEYNYAGCLFLESLNAPDFTDFNSIIYGHHMRNGSMFHDLIKYKDEEFYDAHPYVIFMTPEKNYIVEIFASFVSSVKEDSWRISFAEEQERIDWVKSLLDKSDFTSAITPLPEDHLLTLSTCSYEFDNARYVVYGVLTEVMPVEKAAEGETETTAEGAAEASGEEPAGTEEAR